MRGRQRAGAEAALPPPSQPTVELCPCAAEVSIVYAPEGKLSLATRELFPIATTEKKYFPKPKKYFPYHQKINIFMATKKIFPLAKNDFPWQMATKNHLPWQQKIIPLGNKKIIPLGDKKYFP
jgi:hypothetical protein